MEQTTDSRIKDPETELTAQQQKTVELFSSFIEKPGVITRASDCMPLIEYSLSGYKGYSEYIKNPNDPGVSGIDPFCLRSKLVEMAGRAGISLDDKEITKLDDLLSQLNQNPGQNGIPWESLKQIVQAKLDTY